MRRYHHRISYIKPEPGDYSYSGMHDHGPLPQPKEGGQFAQIVGLVNEAKKASDSYLTEVIEKEKALAHETAKNSTIIPKKSESNGQKKQKRRKRKREGLDLGALWRLQRTRSLADSGQHDGEEGSSASFTDWMQRQVRKRKQHKKETGRSSRPKAAVLREDRSETMLKRIGAAAKGKPPQEAILGPICDDPEQEFSSSEGTGPPLPQGFLPVRAAPPATTQAPQVARPQSPDEGPFQLKSMYQRGNGGGSFPFIVDEERSMRGLQSSGDSDFDLIRPPPSALFRF